MVSVVVGCGGGIPDGAGDGEWDSGVVSGGSSSN
jgi:hypothetical protein